MSQNGQAHLQRFQSNSGNFDMLCIKGLRKLWKPAIIRPLLRSCLLPNNDWSPVYMMRALECKGFVMWFSHFLNPLANLEIPYISPFQKVINFWLWKSYLSLSLCFVKCLSWSGLYCHYYFLIRAAHACLSILFIINF